MLSGNHPVLSALERVLYIAHPRKRLALEPSVMSYALIVRLVTSSTRLLQMLVGDPWSLRSLRSGVEAGWRFRRAAGFNSKEGHLGNEGHVVLG